MSESEKLYKFDSAKDFLPWSLIVVVIVLTTLQLYFQGRIFWCKQGDYALWSSAVLSAHNSQHLIDPYTFTHILHGVLFYWIATLIFPKMSPVWRLLIAVAVEGAWECLENTNLVVERYREATISLDYFGDSIINSFGDIVACIIGFLIASKVKFWHSLVFFIVTEIILIYWIHDSLLINIIMLIYPIDGIREWQNNL